MSSAYFARPVRVALPEGGTSAEIRCPGEALDFMLQCPVQEGPIFESALEACFVATYDPSCCEEARTGFAAFAKAYGLLSDASAPEGRRNAA
jgi:hypothetical protein